jgi:hypothetical protein
MILLRRRIIHGACTLATLAWLAAPAHAQTPAPGRIVAVGDVHGHLGAFTRILRQAGILDSQNAWAGGNATLVQTGDTIDRGPDMRSVLDLLMALEKQAPKTGGRTVFLLGNHEAMNIFGDLRYVTEGNYASFATKDAQKRREQAWKQYVEWRQRRAAARKQPAWDVTAAQQKEWMALHPPGFFEHRDAFGPAGKYGKWLRERPAVALLQGVLFVHGGIAPELAAWKIEDFNRRIASELRSFDDFRLLFTQQGLVLPFFTLEEMQAAITTEWNARKEAIALKQQEAAAKGKTYEVPAEERKHNDALSDFLALTSWISIHPSGPLWFRGYATWTEEEAPPQLEKLNRLGATQFVVGHSPQTKSGIVSRFAGRVFLIDTGMLAGSFYPGGVSAALEIDQGKFTAIYLDRRVALLDAAGRPGADQHEWPLDFTPISEDALGLLGGGAQQPAPQGQPAHKIEPAPAATTGTTPPRASPAPDRVWYGPDSKPLPFQSDQQILDFLQTARVLSMKTIGEGITQPRKVLLERDGVRMHAIFRDVNEEKDLAHLATGRREPFFRDTYIFELAAYQLSKLLGLDNVPPTVKRRIGEVTGSLQIWVENAMTETKRQKNKVRPPDVIQWNRQVQTMHAFDSLVYNTDRNLGNVLIDPNWKLWMIDHTRAFRRYDELKDEQKIVLISREFLEHLQALDPVLAKATLKDSLRAHEIEAMLRRRLALLAHFQKVIAEKGERKALFTWDPAR